MLDIRPVAYVIGLLVAALGGAMLAPALADAIQGVGHWPVFALCGVATMTIGGVTALASAGGRKRGLSIQQAFMLTTFSWLILPVFGAAPFVLGEPNASYTDAFFEAMSGLTTTGSTVFSGLDQMPAGVLLWRGLLQWFGGVGIVVVAMAFLPALKVGGMQLFRSESFDTFGKILPKAAEIAGSISAIYIALTLGCMVAYTAVGMSSFDALVHSMTTIATGGFANYDDSIGHFPAAVEYVAVIFMVLASLPFVRYVQLMAGSAVPFYRDPQIRVFLGLLGLLILALTLYRVLNVAEPLELSLRKTLFNVTSILTGTGYASADYGTWGAFAVALFFVMGLIGGCAGSTCCSIKVFRFQVLWAAVLSQIRRIHSPDGVFTPRYDHRPISEEIISSVMGFFFLFALTLGVAAVGLSLMGLDLITAVSGAATALANVGPGLGGEIGPTSNFASLPDGAKWLLSAVMLIGRLELMSVYVLLTVSFWRV